MKALKCWTLAEIASSFSNITVYDYKYKSWNQLIHKLGQQSHTAHTHINSIQHPDGNKTTKHNSHTTHTDP